MRAVVTGGAGFIGSHVVDALADRGDEVHVVDNFATGRRENLNGAAQVHEHDIQQPLASLFAQVRPERVFHLAAQADVGTSVQQPQLDASVNVLGTLNVLEGARPHDAVVVFTSTGGAMYGECPKPAPEDAPREPLSPYGTSKLCGEEYLATWNRLHGTRHVALRLANVYGPRQLAKLEGGVVAIFMDRLRTGEETSVLELFEACRRVAGVGVEAEHAPARPGEARRSVLDVSLAERELGWSPRTTLEDGLRETWRSTAD